MKSLVQIGFQRDQLVLDDISRCKVLTTHQIRSLRFPGKAGLRKCRERLGKMCERKLIIREHTYSNEVFVYHLPKTKFNHRPTHLISTNWVYIWLNVNYGEVETWQLEYLGFIEFGVRPDSLAFVNGGPYAIEMDRAESHNQFDKIEKYNKLFKLHQEKIISILRNPRHFPRPIIVTTNQKRKDNILQMIRDNNPHNIKYTVKLLEEIIAECERRI